MTINKIHSIIRWVIMFWRKIIRKYISAKNRFFELKSIKHKRYVIWQWTIHSVKQFIKNLKSVITLSFKLQTKKVHRIFFGDDSSNPQVTAEFAEMSFRTRKIYLNLKNKISQHNK